MDAIHFRKQRILTLFSMLLAAGMANIPLAGRASDVESNAAGASSIEQPAVRGVKGRPPTCAVLAAARSPVELLLERRMLGSARATWVERDQIDVVLREQSLSTAFRAEAVSHRAALGKLLNADLLVITRPSIDHVPTKPEEQEVLDVVVCETSQGLRLCSQEVLVAEDPKQTVDQLEELINQAIEKYGEDITRVWTVPPFMSDDLVDDRGYLKQAHARVVEQLLLNQSGGLVVAPDEAGAVGEEIERVGQETSLSRRVPNCVMGRYRHENRGDDRRVRVELKLVQGGKTIEQVAQPTLKPDDVPEFLRNTVSRWSGAGGNRAISLMDPKHEAQQLAKRAAEFALTGHWQEAYALAEASLLLDPDNIETLQLAVRACKIVRQSLIFYNPIWQDPPRLAPFFHTQERAWELYEQVVRLHPIRRPS